MQLAAVDATGANAFKLVYCVAVGTFDDEKAQVPVIVVPQVPTPVTTGGRVDGQYGVQTVPGPDVEATLLTNPYMLNAEETAE